MSDASAKSAGPAQNRYPGVFAARELELIALRRRARGEAEVDVERRPQVGLALSGGGIRSATFSLGVLQALAKTGLLGKVDYLSTVSGGGYIGSFLGSLFVRIGESPAPTEGKKPTVEDILADPHSRQINWLRDNGRFLAPHGAGDAPLALAILLRNWVAIQVVLGTTMLAAFLVGDLVRYAAFLPGIPWLSDFCRDGVIAGWCWWSPYLAVPAILFLVWVVPTGWAYWLVPAVGAIKQRSNAVTPALSVIGVLGVAAVLAVRQFQDGAADHTVSRDILIGLAAVAAMTLVFWIAAGSPGAGREHAGAPAAEQALQAEHRARSRLGHWLATGLALAVATLFLAVVDSLGQTAYALFAQHEYAVVLSRFSATGLGGLVALGAVSQRIAAFTSAKPGNGRFRPSLSLVTLSAALLVVVALLTTISAVAHGFAWGGNVPAGNPAEQIVRSLRTPPEVALSSDRRIVVGPPMESAPLPVLPVVEAMDGFWLGAALAVASGLAIAFGRTLQFLNQSSQASFYASRLTRAYLGASNPERAAPQRQSVRKSLAGDEIELRRYRPHRFGGPLHLINVTLNETVDGRSQLQQRDRKGMGLAIGPVAASVGVQHHALWMAEGEGALSRPLPLVASASTLADGSATEPPFQVFQPPAGHESIRSEVLGLGKWIAISGAAVSTGLGARTNLGLSLLCGLFNVRLGHWWYSGVDPSARQVPVNGCSSPSAIESLLARVLPVQTCLLSEMLARFPGTARPDWYLSDGGHFENTGAYELIRRRLPLIVICDNGQDTDYRFPDVANLVRKARIDLDAEISFFSESELDNHVHLSARGGFGTLEQLCRGGWKQEQLPGPPPGGVVADQPAGRSRWSVSREDEGLSLACATLAWIRYGGDAKPASLLLLIKPTLTGDEPVDLLNYHDANPTFPHQTTVDQFFDEAQWESYRKLGEHIAGRIFAPTRQNDQRWLPATMDPTLILGLPPAAPPPP